MQISELAQLTGVSTHALRHYEKLGMLEPARRASGYREYPDSMRREVIFIAMSRKVGISLKLIAAQLPAFRAGRLAITQMVEALLERAQEIDQHTERLRIQRDEVMSNIVWLKKQDRLYQARKKQRPKTVGKKDLPPWPKVRSRAKPAAKTLP